MNNKNNTTTGKRSKMNKALRKIDQLNIRIYDTSIQKYLGSRKKINISTREEGKYKYGVYFIKINHTQSKILEILLKQR